MATAVIVDHVKRSIEKSKKLPTEEEAIAWAKKELSGFCQGKDRIVIEERKGRLLTRKNYKWKEVMVETEFGDILDFYAEIHC